MINPVNLVSAEHRDSIQHRNVKRTKEEFPNLNLFLVLDPGPYSKSILDEEAMDESTTWAGTQQRMGSDIKGLLIQRLLLRRTIPDFKMYRLRQKYKSTQAGNVKSGITFVDLNEDIYPVATHS